jgi:hypothetical protein
VLTDLNQQGAGIFVTVNQTDGKGRRKENVTKVRAVFVDVDQETKNWSALEPMWGHMPPSMLVESSLGHFHAYWLVDDCPLSWFGHVQSGLAHHFNSDPQVVDLPRVMRIPGFYHQKNSSVRSKLIFTNNDTHSITEIMEAFELQWPQKNKQKTPAARPGEIIKKGERNCRLMSMAGSLRRVGIAEEELLYVLSRVNQRQVQPPLPDREIRQIVRSARRYPIERIKEEEMQELVRIGALWTKETRDGVEFFSGKLGNSQVFVFQNRWKRQENSPDWEIKTPSDSLLAKEIEPKKAKDEQRGHEGKPREVPQKTDQDDLPF